MAHAHGTRHTPLHKDPADPSRGSPLPPFCVNGVAVRRCALPTSVGFLSLFRFRFLRCRFGLEKMAIDAKRLQHVSETIAVAHVHGRSPHVTAVWEQNGAPMRADNAVVKRVVDGVPHLTWTATWPRTYKTSCVEPVAFPAPGVSYWLLRVSAFELPASQRADDARRVVEIEVDERTAAPRDVARLGPQQPGLHSRSASAATSEASSAAGAGDPVAIVARTTGRPTTRDDTLADLEATRRTSSGRRTSQPARGTVGESASQAAAIFADNTAQAELNRQRATSRVSVDDLFSDDGPTRLSDYARAQLDQPSVAPAPPHLRDTSPVSVMSVQSAADDPALVQTLRTLRKQAESTSKLAKKSADDLKRLTSQVTVAFADTSKSIENLGEQLRLSQERAHAGMQELIAPLFERVNAVEQQVRAPAPDRRTLRDQVWDADANDDEDTDDGDESTLAPASRRAKPAPQPSRQDAENPSLKDAELWPAIFSRGTETYLLQALRKKYVEPIESHRLRPDGSLEAARKAFEEVKSLMQERRLGAQAADRFGASEAADHFPHDRLRRGLITLRLQHGHGMGVADIASTRASIEATMGPLQGEWFAPDMVDDAFAKAPRPLLLGQSAAAIAAAKKSPTKNKPAAKPSAANIQKPQGFPKGTA